MSHSQFGAMSLRIGRQIIAPHLGRRAIRLGRVLLTPLELGESFCDFTAWTAGRCWPFLRSLSGEVAQRGSQVFAHVGRVDFCPSLRT